VVPPGESLNTKRQFSVEFWGIWELNQKWKTDVL